MSAPSLRFVFFPHLEGGRTPAGPMFRAPALFRFAKELCPLSKRSSFMEGVMSVAPSVGGACVSSGSQSLRCSCLESEEPHQCFLFPCGCAWMFFVGEVGQSYSTCTHPSPLPLMNPPVVCSLVFWFVGLTVAKKEEASRLPPSVETVS